MRAILATIVAVAAALPPGPAHWRLVAPGASLATPTGAPLFPTLAGRPAAGWLDAFGGPAMAVGWGGYSERHALDAAHELVVVRAAGLLAVYAFRRAAAGRPAACVGQAIYEPRALPDPDGVERALRQAGYHVRRGFLATADAAFAVDAGTFERRAGGRVERYVLIRHAEGAPHPVGVAAPPTRPQTELPQIRLAEAASYPQAMAPAFAAYATEGGRAVAGFFARSPAPALSP